jgi:hypothetical protein
MAKRSRQTYGAVIAACSIAVVLGKAHITFAQGPTAEAEALFNEAHKLLASGDIAKACTFFEESRLKDPRWLTLLNLAMCREMAGQLATAWRIFLDAERQARKGDTHRHQIALDHANRIEPRLSKLTIKVSPSSRIDRLEVLRDNEILEPAMWNRAVPIDGGYHTITARAPGMVPWSTEITAGTEADQKTVEIPKLRAANAR